MKPLTKYNRVAGYLNKIYDMLNADFFGGELERPVITIQSTPRAYGHYTLFDAWDVRGAGEHEINIGAGTLDRPIELIVSTLLHEMCHQWNDVHGIQDCSAAGRMYHNKYFKAAAETHGLNVSRSERYGWSITSPSDELIEWVLLNDLVEIELNRNDPHGFHMGGKGAASGGVPVPPTKSNSRRYVCPGCGAIVRATKAVNIICGDCLQPFALTD